MGANRRYLTKGSLTLSMGWTSHRSADKVGGWVGWGGVAHGPPHRDLPKYISQRQSRRVHFIFREVHGRQMQQSALRARGQVPDHRRRHRCLSLSPRLHRRPLRDEGRPPGKYGASISLHLGSTSTKAAPELLPTVITITPSQLQALLQAPLAIKLDISIALLFTID
jgi:hypothetical protein